MLKRNFLLLSLLCMAGWLQAQDLERQQQKQAVSIESAFKKKRITEREYYKLQEEQETIVKAIERAKADDYMSAREKNEIYGKLQRAEKRLRKYKTNKEQY
ncbi:hypothetical protein [Niabella beijingensis]|uniref:hypothetical protein n=1 Tax=Niabella beijingensis TaxID=2872700 RepID=UPI001CBDDF4D|nr:hypothetical protein [Niabella beijingensis]MBZ4188353.1 hypothetical protein [Niabella beijingensis]